MRSKLLGMPMILLAVLFAGTSRAQTAIVKLTEKLTEAREITRGAAALYPKAYFAGGTSAEMMSSKAIDTYNYVTNTWDHNMELSVARRNVAAVASGDHVFFAGGQLSGGNTTSAVVDIFDAAGNRTTTQLPSGARYGMGAVYNGGTLIYFAGGETGSGPSDAVDIYDTSISDWVESKTLSVARIFPEAGLLKGKVYFIGGQNAAGNPTTVVDVFDGLSGSVGANITEPRQWGHVVVSTPNKIFVAGGYRGNGNTNVVDVITDNGGRTTTPTPLSVKRHAIGATTVGGLVFFAGGRASYPSDYGSYAGWCPVVDVYDLAADNWTTVRYLSEPRHNVAAVSIGSKALFAGGYRGDLANQNDYRRSVIEVYDPEVVISSPVLPSVIPKGVSNVTASVTVDDVNKVKSVEFISVDITEPGTESKTPLTANGNVYTKTFTTADLNDEVGIVYKIKTTDYSGRETVTTETVANIQYGAEAAEQKITLVGGTTQSAYRIISVPLRLSSKGVLSVFNEMGNFDAKQWRIFDYNPSKSESEELTSSSEILIGKGYWLITRQGKSVFPGEGITAALTGQSNELYTTITLKPDWNLIGNPFGYDITWAKVLTYNGSPSGVGQLNTFSNNNIGVGTVLSAFGGGFVENTTGSDVQLKIPAPKSLSTGGRVATPEKIDLNAKEWQFTLALTDGQLTNSVGGIGMHGKATLTGRDDFDGVTPPILDGIGMFEMAIYHPEIDKNFCREVVPTTDNYEWEFQILRKSDNALKLEWEPERIEEGAKELYLYDPATMEMKNMRTERYYNIPASSSHLRILFGDQDYVNERKDQLLPFFGTPYPNPSAGTVFIPFHVAEPMGSSAVSIDIYDGMGRFVRTVVEGQFSPGDHQAEWDADGRSGLFVVQMKAGDAVKRHKLVVK